MLHVTSVRDLDSNRMRAGLQVQRSMSLSDGHTTCTLAAAEKPGPKELAKAYVVSRSLVRPPLVPLMSRVNSPKPRGRITRGDDLIEQRSLAERALPMVGLDETIEPVKGVV